MYLIHALCIFTIAQASIVDYFDFTKTEIITNKSDTIVVNLGSEFTESIENLQQDAIELLNNKTKELKKEVDIFYDDVISYINSIVSIIIQYIIIAFSILIAFQIISNWILYRLLKNKK